MTAASFEVAGAPLDSGITHLEASAGTGKTYTLSALFLRLIAEAGLEVGQILVTTFTKPATAELRDRIRKRLQQTAAMFDHGPGEDALLVALAPRYLPAAAEIRPRIERALRQFDEAAIFTIHSFCTRLLQERAFESGLPFDAEPLENEDELIEEIAADFWRRRIYHADLRIGASARLEGLSVRGLLPPLYPRLNRPTMTVLPPHQPGALDAAEADLCDRFTALEQAWAADSASIRATLADLSWAKSEMKKADAVAERFEALARCLSDPATCAADYAALAFFSATNVAAQKDARKKTPAPQHKFFAECDALLAARSAWVLLFQREFLEWAPSELARRKEQRNVLSFNDLLTRLRDALLRPGGSGLVEATRQRYHAALVDEFQDTDPVQAEIFERLFHGHGRLYLIGDPKQAIYSFRGADVFSYLAATERADHRHELSANQRSVTPLVHAVNAIFQRNPDAFIEPRIRFHPATAAGRHDALALVDAGAPVTPFKFWAWSSAEPVNKGVAQERLPRVVADQIVAQLHSATTSGGQPLRASDFAVLTMTNAEAESMRAALVAAGLPAVVLTRASVFASAEATEMLAVLTALATPTLETAVRAALATTALGFTAADLTALTDTRWEQTLDRFLRHHLRWVKEGFFPAFRALLVEAGIRPRLLALPDGERRLANLLHLAELLHHAATAQRLGPAALVRWLGQQIAAGGPVPEDRELRLESDEQAVKVVTVHKSKGLEFAIVWCPFSWANAELKKNSATTFHDPITRALVLDLGSGDHDAHRALAEHEELTEDTRLLYVALTRAKLQCHFVWGRFNQCANSAAAWVLHPPGGVPAEAVAMLKGRALGEQQLNEDLAALVAAEPRAIEVVALPEPAGLRYCPPVPEHPPRQAREFTGEIRREFAIGSFSSLIANAAHEERDYDRENTTAETAVPATGIHAFPRGRRAGTCLHEIFEKLDFTDPGAVEPLVQRKLDVFGFGRPDLRAAVAANVKATLTVELEPGLRLATVTNEARLNELEFHLPVGRLDAAALERVLGESLSFADLTGFLKGFIDLVFEHAGKFYIADWKSNWLGTTADDYTPEAVAAEMRRHHYGVQYHLYSVALHRYLARRIPDYDHATHFGGVFYIFLRGVDPARPELGVFRDRPSRERIEALDALLS